MSDREKGRMEVGVEKRRLAFFFSSFFICRRDSAQVTPAAINSFTQRASAVDIVHGSSEEKTLKEAAETYQRGEMPRVRRPKTTTTTEIAD